MAIANLVYGYAERVDRGDFEGVGELFAHGTYRAVVGEDVMSFSGRDEVAGCIRSMVLTYDGIPGTKHVTTNLIIEVDEEAGAATARSYYSVLQARPGLALQVVIAGRYEDRFDCHSGAWSFADRLIHCDLVGDLSHHLRASPGW